jgi:hypothetical protein
LLWSAVLKKLGRIHELFAEYRDSRSFWSYLAQT